MFKMEIDTSGNAFGNEYDPPYVQKVDKIQELNRIMREITVEIACGKTCGCILDINGNSIGKWREYDEKNRSSNDIRPVEARGKTSY